MASIMSISAEELRLARKGKFKRKKPKKPKAGAGLATYENWISRYNQWCKDAKHAASDYKKKEKIREQVRGHR